MIQRIELDGVLYAIAVYPTTAIPVNLLPATRFLTDPSEPMQVGVLKLKDDVPRHSHPPRLRTISQTQETLVMRRGLCIVSIYDEKNDWIESVPMIEGTVLTLLRGAHAVEVFQPCEIVEIKSGPYDPELDKVRA